ncbi:hypothetical protein [Rivularia sp. UHCC 0363]|uniref:hypothetical protein n=1 Tax=Rivularia sp. UHCC 0363 TaxID=3110244 RepID=UPI002B2051CF|nr:hypothetical protein [Rivularia sp. UHCC 0363]MEA5593267.1 hypothetical protein [Rivularia sp. UHCC 0363]
MSNQNCRELGSETNFERHKPSFCIRQEAAQVAFDRGIATHICNGEEQNYRNEDGCPNFIAKVLKSGKVSTDVVSTALPAVSNAFDDTVVAFVEDWLSLLLYFFKKSEMGILDKLSEL